MEKELVIAAYDKNYNWVSLLDVSIKQTIYLKGNITRKPFKKSVEILIEPNLGRDVHTFFYHIVKNYNNLSNYTFFSQDHPFDHVANYTEIINGNIDVWDKYSKQSNNGCWFFNTYSEIIECDQTGYPQHCGLDIKSVYEHLFLGNCPEKIQFVPSGHFCVSKECILQNRKEFYEKILFLLENYEITPWIIERLEPYIFKIYDKN
jgi:hypothetical protein